MSAEFDAARQQEVTGAPVTFGLAGREWRCRRKVPFGLTADLIKATQNPGPEVVDALVNMITGAVCKEQRDEFHALVLAVPEDDDDEAAVDLADLGRAAQEIIERTTGAPFGSTPVSLPGRASNGATSQVRSGSGDTTSRPHRHVSL